MKKRDHVATTAVLAFSIVWLFDHYVALSVAQLPYVPDQAIKYLSSAAFYFFTFRILLHLYFSVVYERIIPDRVLVGKWFQIFEIRNYEGKMDLGKEANSLASYRYGEVDIFFRADKTLQINAINQKTGARISSSRWESTSVSYEDGKLFIFFQSQGAGRGSTHGTMNFQLHETKKEKLLSGEFNDSSPANHHGTIQLYSDQAKYESELAALGLS